MIELFSNIGLGLSTALQPHNLLFCTIGVMLGTFVGVVPGVGGLAAMSLLLPLTFYLNPTTALIMLAGIWYGTGYGGRMASILLNVPGSAANSITCIDGYPMTRQGRAGVALFVTALSSFFGACVGIVLMMFVSVPLVSAALSFGPWEYFALLLLGLVGASTVSSGSAPKSLAMVVVGIALGLVGMDHQSGTMRLTFGQFELAKGVSLVAVAMGLFGVTEMIATARTLKADVITDRVDMRSMKPTRDDAGRLFMPMVRGAGIGSLIGVLPGVGVSLASFMAYATEVKVAREPSRFGKGAIEGVVAPEAADNAAEQTGFIPTMTLGIPGSASMALILGVLLIHGITPGPTMMAERPDMFWGLVMSFWVGNIILLILNIPLIGIWIKLLKLPFNIMYPSIIVFISIGTYAVGNSIHEVYQVIVLGLLGYCIRVLGFPAIPMLLGFILGPMMEEHFKRSMTLSRGNFEVFLTRPISATLLALVLAILVWVLWSSLRRSFKKSEIVG